MPVPACAVLNKTFSYSPVLKHLQEQAHLSRVSGNRKTMLSPELQGCLLRFTMGLVMVFHDVVPELNSKFGNGQGGLDIGMALFRVRVRVSGKCGPQLRAKRPKG